MIRRDLPPFEIEMLSRSRWRVTMPNKRTVFECDSRTLTEFLRASDITADQRRALFETALARLRSTRENKHEQQ